MKIEINTTARMLLFFSPAGMDFFAMKNEDVEKGDYWSLIGVSDGDGLEPVRTLARQWLSAATNDPRSASALPVLGR